MRRRVYFSFIGLLLPAALILAILLSMVFYNTAKKQEMSAVRNTATIIADILNRGIYDGTIAGGDYTDELEGIRIDDHLSGATRLTFIAPDGTVLLDSAASVDTLENHSGREEFTEALEGGTGESLRYSGTLNAETYYYALRLRDGNILRLAKTVRSIGSVFAASVPAVCLLTALILVFTGFAANGLTKRIVEPLYSIDFDGENAAIYDELLPYVKRIDKQKREIAAQIAELRDRASTIEAITGNMKEGLILLDKNGVTLSANKSARDIFGDMERVSILHICRDLEFQNGVRQCLSGEGAQLQMERGGKVYSVFFSPVLSDGAVNGAVILFVDATEKNRAEKQRREFSANVSHELKTPLTTISALSEMIENGMAKDGDIKAFASKITEQAGRLLNIIDDIIRLSEFDEGGTALEKSVFDLYDLAETVIASLKGKAGDVALCLEGEHFDMNANRHMIDELLYNLIDNGIKYNKAEGSVSVALTREGGFAVIAVADTGIGIPAQYQQRMFERFFRVDKSRSKKTGGTGLGLSIVKHIAEYHGGRAVLESAEGVGTTVTCYIPR